MFARHKILSLIAFVSCGLSAVSFTPNYNNGNLGESNNNSVDLTFSTPFGEFKDTNLKTSTKKLNKGLTWLDAKNHFDTVTTKGKYSDGSIIDPKGTSYTFNKWVYFDTTQKKNVDLIDTYRFDNNTVITAVFDVTNADVTFTIAEGDKGKGNFGDKVYSKTLTAVPGETIYADIKRDSIPTVTDSNYIFSHYEMSDHTKLNNEYVFTGNITLTAVFKNNPGVPNDWEKDSWSVLIAAANKGFDSMSTFTHEQGGYKPEFDASEYNGVKKIPGSFIGLTKTCTIGNVDYKVRVIDENTDPVNSSTKTVLTFEFTTLVHPGKAYAASYNNYNMWSNSAINKFLNNQFFKLLPVELQSEDGIRTVEKYTNKGNNAAKDEVTATNSKLFSLSLKELGFDNYPDGTAVANEGQSDTHNLPYKYYGEHKVALESSTIKKYYNLQTKAEEEMPYWTRSPDIDTPYFAYDINENGGLNSSSSDILSGKGIDCAFCIGEDITKKIVTFDVKSNSGTWKDGTSTNLEIKLSAGQSLKNALDLIPSSQLDPIKSGSIFMGWYTSKSGGTKITNPSTYTITDAITVYAQFETTAGKITITYANADKIEYTGKTLWSKSTEYKTTITPKVYDSIEGIEGTSGVTTHTLSATLDGYAIYKTSDKDHKQLSGVSINSDGQITIPAKVMTENITIEVVYRTISLDWETIIKICEKDEANQLTNGGNPGDIVKKYFDLGDLKGLNYNGTTYNVRVIGLAHSTDKFTNSESKTVTAAMTFEFADCIGKTKFLDNSSNVRDYTKSKVYSYVNDLYNNFESGHADPVKNAIKQVSKEYLVYTSSRSHSFESTGMKFFLLSVNEDCMSHGDSTKSPFAGHSEYDEGIRYELYTKIMQDAYHDRFQNVYRKNYTTVDSRGKTSTESNIEYHLRTYAPLDTWDYPNYIAITNYDSSGKEWNLLHTYEVTSSYGVAPAFCI